MSAPKSRRGLRAVTCAVMATAVAVGTVGCTPAAQDHDDDTLTVWSLENLPDRVAATRANLDRFTKETGIHVKLVAVDETQIPQLLQSAVLSGDLPDVIGALPLAYVREIDDLDLIDTATTDGIVKDLGAKTFDASAMTLTSDGDRHLSVPSDAWSQIVVYRKDLFAQAGLEPPTTYEAIAKAAHKLTADGRFGITLATDPTDQFTTQTFEALALSNGCQLVDSSGNVTLDSPQCQKTWDLYGDLATKGSPRGTQSVDSTRATYFDGGAAMVVWSTFLLDELAGLRNDAAPACRECADDPQWLAEHSGIVTGMSGPDNPQGSTYGEITSWTVLQGADPGRASRLVKYMMSDGYPDWLGMAPEGKVPVRTGDAEDPHRFINAWEKLEAGVDTKKPLSDIYDSKTMQQLTVAPGKIDSWAIPQGQGQLLGPVAAQLPIAKTASELASGQLTSREAAQQAQREVEDIQKESDR
ncbi:ABC transporter substrate-binding protein [Cellulomonas sp. PhB143]|uniref:ABC transporter substrate-binding protein n=1 Tax=Cellulomonas sp. PhB143 TaxID=2485186 RepID=UPI000F916E8A|nr:ABC transporter substrate-binding protein [Cellulomonas sp. PhB143]ROS75472.1 multiple sugar transport system substrate-binding protein [Cellulomonas sp. PhB143]